MQLWARTSAILHTGSGIHPATYAIFIGSFVEGKPVRTWLNTLASSRALVKERVELYLYLYPSLGFYGHFRTPFTFLYNL
jgi:hypothetical protein